MSSYAYEITQHLIDSRLVNDLEVQEISQYLG
jgi:hypothetical protein